jgi:protein disulfide-isomerase-like protein
MKVSVLLVGLLGLCRGDEAAEIEAAEPKPSDVVVLTVANFEHDTQVTSGATTGDWFVKFYAPWCGHCKALAPGWDELARELKTKADEGMSINVAKVDVTTNVALGKRFDVKGFPSLIFFSKGMMYKYPAGKEWPREKEALLKFALGAYKDAAEGEPTPPPPNLADEVKKVAAQLVEAVRPAPLFPFPFPRLPIESSARCWARLCWSILLTLGSSNPQVKFYGANPGAVEENEWGFLVAGFGMGAVSASGLLLTVRMFMGPSIPQSNTKTKGE